METRKQVLQTYVFINIILWTINKRAEKQLVVPEKNDEGAMDS